MKIVKDNVPCFPNLRSTYNEKGELVWLTSCKCGECKDKEQSDSYQSAMSIWSDHAKQAVKKKKT